MDTDNKFSFLSSLLLFILLGFIGSITPYGYLLILIVCCYVFFSGVSFEKLLEFMWPLLIISLFVGTYFGIPGHENIYLFRFLLPIYIGILFVFGQLNLKNLSYYKIPLLILLILFILSSASYMFALYKDQVFRYSYYLLEIFLIFFLCFEKITSKKELLKTMNYVNYFFIANLLVGIVEILLGIHLKLSSANIYVTTTIKYQPTGFFYNTNDYALFISVYYPIIIYFIRNKFLNWRLHAVYVLVTLTSLFVVISSYSRLGILSLGINVVITVYQFYGKKFNLIAFLGFPIWFYSILKIPLLNNLFNTIFVSFTQKNGSTSARELLYQRLWQICKDSKFMGIGAGGAPRKLYNMNLGFESINSDGYSTGHNFFLELLANLGIFGFSLFMLLIIYVVKVIVRNANCPKVRLKDKDSVLMGIEVLTSFLASMIALSTVIEKRYLWFSLIIILISLQQSYYLQGKIDNKDFAFNMYK
ncbi:O-antigen ligase family protein [Enterococcus mundtii]|uniref:O-antigen ligase-related domain-containing protein n=1 Tax=Enterococcus mundtii TaxID=53346 RepID=A0A242KWQ2_ENTMU|nr:O-antigen ligase family protein [Enterococcus mundtii]OTP26386.1 hypothetical protein A5802_000097 [Enterococcus mundtii]